MLTMPQMSDQKSITLAETMRAKDELQNAIRAALCQFTDKTGIKIDMVYVRKVEMFGDFGVIASRYNVEVEVKL